MKTLRIALSALMLSFATNAAAQNTVEHEGDVQWKLNSSGSHSALFGGRTYELYNLSLGRGVKRQGGRGFGVANIGWTSPADHAANIKIVRQPSKRGAMINGELVALYLKDYGYLYYKHQQLGLNWGGTNSPRYQWRFDDGLGAGHVLKTNTPVSLQNSVEKDSLIYCKREFGMNVRWAKDAAKFGCKYNTWSERAVGIVKDRAVREVRKALEQ